MKFFPIPIAAAAILFAPHPIAAGPASHRALTLASTGPSTESPRVAPEFRGVWTNENPQFYNWWVIGASKVINFGIAADANGVRCKANEATILAPNRLDVSFGNSGPAILSIEDGKLIMRGDQGRRFSGKAVHVPSTPPAICLIEGAYVAGAPYPE